jgi:hypothetical protein
MDISIGSRVGSDAVKQAGEPQTGPVQIDPDASAALEEAVRSARPGPKPSPAPSAPTAPAMAKDATTRRRSSAGFVAQAAFALLLVAAGWSASYMGTLANEEVIRRLEVETARSQDILARLGTDLEALRKTVAAFKEVEHTASAASATEQTNLVEKVERLAIGLQEPGRKISALEGRFDRMESQIMATLAGLNAKPPAPSAPPAVEATLRQEAPAPKPGKGEPVDGWVLREVYNGAALVENRNRRLYEVMPGGILPGVGRIEAIERRGTRWVVLTDRGFIGTYR